MTGRSAEVPWLLPDDQPSLLAHLHTQVQTTGTQGWACSSVGSASDRHTAEVGSIPRYGKEFFSQGHFGADSHMCVCTSQCAIAYINVCVHVKDAVVHVRAWWIMETLKHLACTVVG